MGETGNEIPWFREAEIIRLVEQSHLPVRRTLVTLGILPMTFYRLSVLKNPIGHGIGLPTKRAADAS